MISLGKAILIPVLNGECNTAEELALGNEVPDDLAATARYLRNCAKVLGDAIDKDTAMASFGPDGGRMRPVPVKRVHTTVPFSVTYYPDDILSSDGPGGFLCEPDPNPSLAQADGYWAQVRPQRPGTYILQTYGVALGETHGPGRGAQT